jgi:hypothetical protein
MRAGLLLVSVSSCTLDSSPHFRYIFHRTCRPDANAAFACRTAASELRTIVELSAKPNYEKCLHIEFQQRYVKSAVQTPVHCAFNG